MIVDKKSKTENANDKDESKAMNVQRSFRKTVDVNTKISSVQMDSIADKIEWKTLMPEKE